MYLCAPIIAPISITNNRKQTARIVNFQGDLCYNMSLLHSLLFCSTNRRQCAWQGLLPLPSPSSSSVLSVKSQLSRTFANHIFLLAAGPERELDQVTVFSELARLLPMRELVVCFIGPTVPDSRSGPCFLVNKILRESRFEAFIYAH
jgi:hypothetical protein